MRKQYNRFITRHVRERIYDDKEIKRYYIAQRFGLTKRELELSYSYI